MMFMVLIKEHRAEHFLALRVSSLALCLPPPRFRSLIAAHSLASVLIPPTLLRSQVAIPLLYLFSHVPPWDVGHFS